jgi:arginyl-tRNA synthetase
MNLLDDVSKEVSAVVSELYDVKCDAQLTFPEPEHGDLSTNTALKLASQLGRNPRDVASEICSSLAERGLDATVAGPGFINIHVSYEQLWKASQVRQTNAFEGKSVVVEYSCPNYFKELHAGHLYQTLYGDAIARMIERSGARVHRTNFGADVGLSAARALWGIITHLGGEYPDKLSEIPEAERTKFIASRYVDGAQADTNDDEHVSAEIMEVNKRIYAMHSSGDTTSAFAQIYFTCRDWCRQYFERLYKELRVDTFEKFYPESSTESRGRQEVESRKDTLFSESRGALIYEGEKEGLHTRVFITSEGLPTYETKDIGLIMIELEEFAFDHRILITGREQAEYMKVVWRVADHIVPGIGERMTHLTNGLIRFGNGQKMSSRMGNVTTAMDVLEAVRDAVGASEDTERDEHIALGALKYEFLRHKLGGDIAFDPKESVSLQGNSGPYLQYAVVRAESILAKSAVVHAEIEELEPAERLLVRKLSHYAYVLDQATRQYEAHTLCTYLYELASEFNVFYENNRVLGDDREGVRVQLVESYATTLKHGLELLGIQVPEKM